MNLGQGRLSPHPISRCHRVQEPDPPPPMLSSQLDSVQRRKEGEGEMVRGAGLRTQGGEAAARSRIV